MEGAARDEKEKQYQVLWEQEKKVDVERKVKIKREERGGGGVRPAQLSEVAKGKKRAREERRASTSDEEEGSSGDDR